MLDSLQWNRESVERNEIPILELQPAVLASRICKTIESKICRALKECFLFADSVIFLAGIRNQGRSHKPFVSKRVGKMQSKANQSKGNTFLPSVMLQMTYPEVILVTKLLGQWTNDSEFMYLPKEKCQSSGRNMIRIGGECKRMQKNTSSRSENWEQRTSLIAKGFPVGKGLCDLRHGH